MYSKKETVYTSLNTLIPSEKCDKIYKVSFRIKAPTKGNIDDQENYIKYSTR
jgi:hypothetical protein